VDQDGFILDVLVQSCRNTKTAKRLMRHHIEESKKITFNNFF
jgi:transposase-like protein